MRGWQLDAEGQRGELVLATALVRVRLGAAGGEAATCCLLGSSAPGNMPRRSHSHHQRKICQCKEVALVRKSGLAGGAVSGAAAGQQGAWPRCGGQRRAGSLAEQRRAAA